MTPPRRKAKAFRVRHNPRKAKSHRVYAEVDVRELYDVCRNTVWNWMKAGLQPIEGLPQRIFTGAELNRFHAERAEAARRKPVGAEIYCVPCVSQQSMNGRPVQFSTLSGRAGRLLWDCPECGREASIRIGPDNIARLEDHGVLIRRTT